MENGFIYIIVASIILFFGWAMGKQSVSNHYYEIKKVCGNTSVKIVEEGSIIDFVCK